MKKKKIGLLTMPILQNYGGIIQIAALYYILQENGYCPVLINKRYNQPKVKVLLNKIIENNPFYFIIDFKSKTQKRKSIFKLTNFINDFFVSKTKDLYNEKELIKAIETIDTIIVGSDQVWRYKYVKENYKHYFLSFVNNNKRKVAYAASFGVDNWEGSESSIEQVKDLLQLFHKVGVREDAGIEICKNTFDYPEAKHVLDPTLLPGVNFYNSIIDKEDLTKSISLFNYVLDKSKLKQDLVNKIAVFKDLNIDIIDDHVSKGKNKPSMGEWLYHFRNAEFIVTDSFHGTVFSIIFNKQFISIGNEVRGMARFKSLLKIFDLESRLITVNQFVNIEDILNNDIDYGNVNEILELENSKSLNFLLESIK